MEIISIIWKFDHEPDAEFTVVDLRHSGKFWTGHYCVHYPGALDYPSVDRTTVEKHGKDAGISAIQGMAGPAKETQGQQTAAPAGADEAVSRDGHQPVQLLPANPDPVSHYHCLPVHHASLVSAPIPMENLYNNSTDHQCSMLQCRSTSDG
jgi:hypothetical protein